MLVQIFGNQIPVDCVERGKCWFSEALLSPSPNTISFSEPFRAFSFRDGLSFSLLHGVHAGRVKQDDSALARSKPRYWPADFRKEVPFFFPAKVSPLSSSTYLRNPVFASSRSRHAEELNTTSTRERHDCTQRNFTIRCTDLLAYCLQLNYDMNFKVRRGRRCSSI